MRKFGSLAFLLVYAASVVLALLSLGNASLFAYALGGFGLSFLASTVVRGSKSGLQAMFLSAGSAIALATITFSWGGWGYFGIGLCLFMVATMKIDGGDYDG
jgi:hypothetical protein